MAKRRKWMCAACEKWNRNKQKNTRCCVCDCNKRLIFERAELIVIDDEAICQPLTPLLTFGKQQQQKCADFQIYKYDFLVLKASFCIFIRWSYKLSYFENLRHIAFYFETYATKYIDNPLFHSNDRSNSLSLSLFLFLYAECKMFNGIVNVNGMIFLEFSHLWNVANSPIATTSPICDYRRKILIPMESAHIFNIRSIITSEK